MINDHSELDKLKATINAVWADTYPGSVDTQDMSALQCRVKNLAEDRNCWVFNAKVANNKLNELEGNLKHD